MIICICTNYSIIAQPSLLKFDNLSNEDGISQSSVFSIIKDHNGIMWFGTADGLNRFDGYDFRVYKNKPGDTTSLSTKVVVEVFEDSRNNLWIGTLGGGLNLFDRETESFKKYDDDFDDEKSIKGNDIRVIREFRDGELLVGTEKGLNLFNFDLNQCELITLDQENKLFNYVWSINNINDSLYFVGTYGGLYKVNVNKRKVSKRYSKSQNKNSLIHNYTWTICNENNSSLWLGSYLGITRFDLTKEKFERIIPVKNQETGTLNNVFKILEFDEETLLLGTRGGLLFFNKNTYKYDLYLHSVYDKSSLSNDRIYEIYKDDTGIIWIGTDIGISRYDKSRTKFNTYDVTTQLNGTTLPDGQIHGFAVKEDYGTWIATANGLCFYDIKENAFKTLKHSPSRNTISHNDVRALLLKDNYSLWIGTVSGLDKMDIRTGEINNYTSSVGDDDKILSKRINRLFNDSKNRLWIGTARGISRFDKERGKFINYETNNSINQLYNYVSAIIEDKYGNIIFGTYGDGLKVLFNNTNNIVSYKTKSRSDLQLRDNYVLSLCTDEKGEIWVGTNNGLNRFDIENKNFPDYYLSGDAILGIISIAENKFWISTNNGLILFNKTNKTYRRFNNIGEVQSLQFQAGASYQDYSGKLYFGGINGYNSFYPDKVSINELPPNIVVSEISIDNEVIELPRKSMSTNEEIPSLFINYDQKILTVKVSVLHYSSPSNNKCSYYLKGADNIWTDIGNRRHIVYTDLSPGNYTLLVKGANSDGIWSDEIELIHIDVETPPYRTIWAIGLYFIFIFGLVYILMEYNNRRKEKEIEALKRADKLKTEFLAQMSHEIRTPINTILNFVSLVKVDLDNNIGKSLAEYFKIIDNAGARIVRTINLILDMSQFQTQTYDPIFKEFDLVQDVLSHMYNEFKHKAEEKGLKLKLDLNCNYSNILADHYTVTQIFQNLIDNAIKYTLDGHVEIKAINNEKDHILVKISDSGIGITDEFLPNLFSPFSQEEQGYTRQFEGNGLGLALVKNYCDLNKIDISVTSQKNEGTSFTLIFRVA